MKSKEVFKDLKESPLNSNTVIVNSSLTEADDEPSIFGVDDPDDKEFQSHKRRNTEIYRKMKNWD
jgi:hypothetical protein